MGKKDLRIVSVPKWATFVVLVLVSLLMGVLLWALSGKAYSKDQPILAEVVALVERLPSNCPANASVVALLMPLLADVFFFLPWGFFAFLVINRPGRPCLRAFVNPVLFGVAYSAPLVLWQQSLPTQVTGFGDTIWNGCGAGAGALIAQLRRRIQVRFQ